MNFLLPVLLSLSISTLPPLGDVNKKKNSHDHVVCQKAIAAAEKEHGILPELLSAVARVESGRMDPKLKKMTAWPWTITVKGKGHYFPTKTAALEKIRQLKKSGVKDFDVGLLQINNYWHPDAFDNAEEALDPKTNAQYAAKFLKDLYNKHKSWTRAVSCYHSYNPKHGNVYCQRVLSAWNKKKQEKNLHLIQKSRPKTKLKKRSYKRRFA